MNKNSRQNARYNANNNNGNRGYSNNRGYYGTSNRSDRSHNVTQNTTSSRRTCRQEYVWPPVKPYWVTNGELQPPQQPTITFNTQQVFNYTHFLMGKKDYATLNNLMWNMILIRRSIMQSWKTDNQNIDLQLVGTLPKCNPKPIFCLPPYLSCNIKLPQRSTRFNNYTWATVYRSMMPGRSPIDFTLQSFKYFLSLYVEFMVSDKTANRNNLLESLIGERRTALDKKYLGDRTNEEYRKELRLILKEYQRERREITRSIREKYDNYKTNLLNNATDLSVDPTTNPEMKPIWERITLNPIICGGVEPYVADIISPTKDFTETRILFLEFADNYSIDDYIQLIKRLRNKFYTDYPNYSNSNMCDFDINDPVIAKEVEEIYKQKYDAEYAKLSQQQGDWGNESNTEQNYEETYDQNEPYYEEEDFADFEEDGDVNDYAQPVITWARETELREEAMNECIQLHQEDIAKRLQNNATTFEHWKIINKYTSILLNIAHFKIYKKDLEESNVPLDETKIDYEFDENDPKVVFDTFEEQMEKSKLWLSINFYDAYDIIYENNLAKYAPYPKRASFVNEVVKMYSRLNLDEQNSKSRIISAFNKATDRNAEILSIELKATYDLTTMLPQCLLAALEVTGNATIADGVVKLIKHISNDNVTINALMVAQTIDNKQISRNKQYWFLFWAMYFEGMINMNNQTKEFLSSLLQQATNGDDKGSFFKSLKCTHEYLTTYVGKRLDKFRYDQIKIAVFEIGVSLLPTLKLDNYWSAHDMLELIDPIMLAKVTKK